MIHRPGPLLNLHLHNYYISRTHSSISVSSTLMPWLYSLSPELFPKSPVPWRPWLIPYFQSSYLYLQYLDAQDSFHISRTHSLISSIQYPDAQDSFLISRFFKYLDIKTQCIDLQPLYLDLQTPYLDFPGIFPGPDLNPGLIRCQNFT